MPEAQGLAPQAPPSLSFRPPRPGAGWQPAELLAFLGRGVVREVKRQPEVTQQWSKLSQWDVGVEDGMAVGPGLRTDQFSAPQQGSREHRPSSSPCCPSRSTLIAHSHLLPFLLLPSPWVPSSLPGRLAQPGCVCGDLSCLELALPPALWGRQAKGEAPKSEDMALSQTLPWNMGKSPPP